MTKRIPQPRSELSPGVRAHEARLLAVMLRTSRLTWVFGEPGTDKSALLQTGVMPLLQRRRSDRGAARPAAADAAATPERRRQPSQPRFELALRFDDWGQAPLSALKRRLVDLVPAAGPDAGGLGLVEVLHRLHQRMGLHCVVLLDRFEEYLALAPHEAEVGSFASEWVDAVLQRELPVSFLVAVDEAARPRLERFRARLPGFDENMLRLSPVFKEDEQMPAPPRPKRQPQPQAPIKVEDVYALVESTLTRIQAKQSAQRHCDLELDLPATRAPRKPR